MKEINRKYIVDEVKVMNKQEIWKKRAHLD